MINKHTISIISNTTSFDTNGNPVVSQVSIDIVCYFDFMNTTLKFQKEGENIVSKALIMITIQSEIDKLIAINNSNFKNYNVVFENVTYSMLDFNRGLRHISIRV